ncbi:putative ribonuclease H-like domain-containing protein [Tanacetum coccineum]
MSARLRVLEIILLLETYTQESVLAPHKIRSPILSWARWVKHHNNSQPINARQHVPIDILIQENEVLNRESSKAQLATNAPVAEDMNVKAKSAATTCKIPPEVAGEMGVRNPLSLNNINKSFVPLALIQYLNIVEPKTDGHTCASMFGKGKRKLIVSYKNHNLWDVIVNGDLEEDPAPTTGETSAPPAPKTAKQLAARRNQERVKSILLFSIPDEYLLKFHNMDGDDLEELDLRWQVAMLTVRVKKFIQRTGRNMDFKEKRSVSLDKSKIEVSGRNQGRRSYGDNGRSNAPTTESSSQALVAQDGLGGYDWSNDFEVEPVNYALMAISSSSSSSSSDSEGEKYEFQNYELKCREIKINNLNLELEKVVKERDELKDKIAKWEESSKNLDEILNNQMSARDKIGLGYSTQLNELSSNHETDSENSLSIFDGRSSDDEHISENDKFSKNEYKVVPPHITGNFLTPRADISFAGLDEYALRNKIIESQTTELNTKTSETAGKSNDANTKKPKSVNDEEEGYEMQTVRPETQTVKTRDDKSGQTSKKQGIGFRKVKACFVCRSTEHLIKDYNFHDKKSLESNLKIVVNTGVSTRIGLHRLNISTARPVCTARPSISTARPVYASRPIYPRMDNVKNMTTAGKRAVVNTGKGKLDTDLKRSRWVWRPKGNYLDHVSKDSGSFMLKKGNPEILLQDHAVVDSGCSSHMTGNKAYLSDYEDFNGGFVAFGSDPKGGKITGKGKIKTANLDFDDVYFVDELKFNLFSVSQMCDKKNSVLFTESECLILSPSFKLLDESQVVLRAPRKDDVYNLDLKNIIPSGGITCLYANTTADESKLWHMRLGHVNFKNINKLVKGHLVRGLPSKVFVNDHTCVACKKGKQHKASCKAKLERIIRKPLELLHMDLFGPVSVESINKKRYYLVVTDDFNRFSWVFFLATKDETSEILCNLIIGFENQLSHNVKIIRCDNGIEFKNHAINEFCAKKEIKREFSVARTPHHNMVTFLKKPNESVGFTEVVDFLKGTSLRYALTHNPTIYDSLVKQFWQTATVRTLANGTQQLVASIDSKEYTITEASVRRDFVPLLPAMLVGAAVDQGEGSTQPTEPHHTTVDPIPSTSQPPIPSPPHHSPPHSPHHSPPQSPP